MRTLLPLFFVACTSTSHPSVPAKLGTASSLAALEALIDQPGPLQLETIASANWEVPLSGLLNLEKAKLDDRPEPIQIFVHVIRHPQKGVYWVDSGVERDARHFSGWLKRFANGDKLRILTPASELPAPSGVFLTHLHLDHVMGLPDVSANTPIYIGSGDTSERSFMNLLTRGVFNTFLEGKAPLQELEPNEVSDLFGDGSLWAIAVPGHTLGSTAFVARTTTGPVLLTGDACHTRYGWEHGIEPGTFSSDQGRSARSLQRLKDLAARHPAMSVRVGHQR